MVAVSPLAALLETSHTAPNRQGLVKLTLTLLKSVIQRLLLAAKRLRLLADRPVTWTAVPLSFVNGYLLILMGSLKHPFLKVITVGLQIHMLSMVFTILLHLPPTGKYPL